MLSGKPYGREDDKTDVEWGERALDNLVKSAFDPEKASKMPETLHKTVEIYMQMLKMEPGDARETVEAFNPGTYWQ